MACLNHGARGEFCGGRRFVSTEEMVPIGLQIIMSQRDIWSVEDGVIEDLYRSVGTNGYVFTRRSCGNECDRASLSFLPETVQFEFDTLRGRGNLRY